MNFVSRIDPQNWIPFRLKKETSLWARQYGYIAGVDEAGCGPLAGPVVAAAVIFSPFFYIEQVNDSKKLTEQKREEMYAVILDNAVSYGIGIVSHVEIDKINIRQATFKAMRMALGSLKKQPDYVIFDGYELPERFFAQEHIIDGDELCFTIAAASIIAKVTRDRMMIDLHMQYPQYGFDHHKGYATAHHRRMVREHGPCPIHRKTFLKKIISS
ncbi:MAG: ribonuclease HII [Calditrichia bacterium]